MENIEKTKNWTDYFTNEFKKNEKILNITEMKDYISNNIKNMKDETQIKLIYKIVSENQPFKKD